MLAPHELKSKSFSKSLKGYNPSEVDDYIEFLIDKYTELYRENSELERKLRIVVTNFDEIRDEEEAIRSTLLKSQKLGEKIIRDANERADVITGSIKERCDAIITSFREQLRAEKNEMWEIRTRIIDFKKNLYDIYRQHIEELQKLSVNEIEDIVLPDENEIVGRIFSDVRETIQKEIISEANRRKEESLEEQPAADVGAAPSDEEKLDELKRDNPEAKEILEGVSESSGDGTDDFISLIEQSRAQSAEPGQPAQADDAAEPSGEKTEK